MGWGRDWVEWGGGGDLTDFLSTFSSRFQPAQLALGGKGAGRVQCHSLFHMEGTGGLLFLSSSGQGSLLPHYCEWVIVL